MRFLLLLLGLMIALGLRAAEINLGLSQSSTDLTVRITVDNRARDPATLTQIELELGAHRALQTGPFELAPGTAREFVFTVPEPPRPGTYALVSRVRYLNDGRAFTLLNAGTFYWIRPNELAPAARLPEVSLGAEGMVWLEAANPSAWRLLLPDEADVLQQRDEPGRRGYLIRGRHDGFFNNYTIYAVREEVRDGVNGVAIVPSRLGLDTRDRYTRGRTADAVLYGGILTALLLFAGSRWWPTASPRLRPLAPTAAVVAKVSARVFWFCGLYLLLRHLPNLCEAALRALPPANFYSWGELFRGEVGWGQFWTRFVAFPCELLGPHLRSDYYRRFFAYGVVDYYGYFILVASPLYHAFLGRDETPAHDKYAAALGSILRTPLRLLGRPAGWDTRARLGLLTLCVKLFYIPLLCGWAIQNIEHSINLTRGFGWSHGALNAYVMHTAILVDTLIFAFGYAFEGKFLRNQIRSVEPTILGWVVCLWCYPPFNSFSFGWMDRAWFPITIPTPGWATPILEWTITLGWCIFAWASVALGPRGSNLTNRGIVGHGPYRYCRHPAYAVKLLIWVIEAVFFGRYFVGLLVGFIIIYVMRALTEEWHLQRDPDYREYKRHVPYRFIPGLF